MFLIFTAYAIIKQKLFDINISLSMLVRIMLLAIMIVSFFLVDTMFKKIVTLMVIGVFCLTSFIMLRETKKALK